ncbi:Hypothetical_protein [Hexamita inflata]|uniref:Hypothetical_protein n=1 Tax=Hexamita inflata TaxID=28002 RepID=A0AA86PZJ8_9EUKA|nr:Hypothetical protein HINF_LOCUS35456 [Hexamita inflata]
MTEISSQTKTQFLKLLYKDWYQDDKLLLNSDHIATKDEVLEYLDKCENTLKSIAFQNQELAIRMLKSVSTIVNKHGHFIYCHFSCVHGNTKCLINNKTSNYNKNYCKRRVGYDSLSGDGYYSKKGRYNHIKYVYGLDDQLVGPATMFINKGYSYRVIKFYGEHDKGEFYCKETKNVQRKVKYTAEQERIILEKVQKHNLFDQIITLW